MDQMAGKRQAVISSVGPAYRSCRTISGATIPGDGSAALTVGVTQMVHSVDVEGVGGPVRHGMPLFVEG